MKLRTLVGVAAAGMLSASVAQAAPFYLNIGTDYHPAGGDKECPTCTSMKNEFLFAYQSTTTIIDDNGDLMISAGDSLSTDGGLEVGGFNLAGLSENQITGFLPNQTFGINSNNGYGDDWLLSFGVKDLEGVVTGVTGAGVPMFQYGPGVVNMYLTFDGNTFINFMDIAVTGGGSTGVSTVLTGTADFTNIAAADLVWGNLFNSGDFLCGGSSGFYDIWLNCGEGAGEALTINFFSSFDTNIFVSDFQFDGVDTFTLTSNHDGSGTFAVPEPSVLALLGFGLLGLGAVARRRRMP